MSRILKLAVIVSILLIPCLSFANTVCVIDVINSELKELKKIKMMNNRIEYELVVNNKIEKGLSDSFLRKRNGKEIIESKLSSGCGDYAIAFYYLMQNRGVNCLFIDSAELSLRGLITKNAGHAIVAVQDNNSWTLIDTTQRKILSINWNINEKIFLKRYWIGYIGKLEDYPVHSYEELRKFYKDTLNKIPPTILSENVIGYKFIIDKSVIMENGNYFNNDIPRLLQVCPRVYEEYKFEPKRFTEIKIIKGDKSNLNTTAKEWVYTIKADETLNERFIIWADQYNYR